MADASPLRQIQSHWGAQFIHYGPPQDRSQPPPGSPPKLSPGSHRDESPSHRPESDGVDVVESFGAYEAEYAAIRSRVGVLHMPQRGLVVAGGSDRTAFLHRMVSNDVESLSPGECRRAFLLNEKGRIVADLIVMQDNDRTLLEADLFNTDLLVQVLEAKLFAEDVTLGNTSEEFVHLALHGPASMKLLIEASADGIKTGLDPMTHRLVTLEGQSCLVYRRDEAGSLGLHLLVPVAESKAVYQRLLDVAGFEPNADVDAAFAEKRRQSLRGRPIGWLAYNTARIEAGTPIFHIDFGTDSLPAETGVVNDAVSFTKGCFVGQEIVARMKNLGHPKRVLVGLKFKADHLPIAGAAIFEPSGEDGAAASQIVIGGLTSSTISPLLGHVAIGFAVIKWGHHLPGTPVAVPAEGRLVEAETHAVGFPGCA